MCLRSLPFISANFSDVCGKFMAIYPFQVRQQCKKRVEILKYRVADCAKKDKRWYQFEYIWDKQDPSKRKYRTGTCEKSLTLIM